MNKLVNVIKYLVIRKQKLFLFLLILFLLGIVFGSLFISILSDSDRVKVVEQVTSFFAGMKGNKFDSFLVFKNSFLSNLILLLFLWILGISVIGIPIIIIIDFIKGFTIGFSIGAIIYQYKLLGLLGAFTYIFPHVIVMSVVILILSYYSFFVSTHIFYAIIKKQNINFKGIMGKYNIILLIAIIVTLVASLIEAFLSPLLLKVFLLFL